VETVQFTLNKYCSSLISVLKTTYVSLKLCCIYM